MAEIVLILMALVAIGNLLDFLLGERNNKRIKAHLTPLYIAINERRWNEILGGAIGVFIEALRKILSNLSRAKTIVFLAAYSLFITATVFIIVSGLSSRDMHDFAHHVGTENKVLYISIPLSMICDVISWSLLKICLIARNIWTVMAMFGVVQFILFYITASLINGLLWVCIMTEGGTLTGLAAQFISVFRTGRVMEAFNILQDDIVANEADAPAYIYGIGVMMPTIALGSFIITAYALSVFEPLLRRPLSLIIERIDESQKGVFTLLAGVIVTVAGLIKALPTVQP